MAYQQAFILPAISTRKLHVYEPEEARDFVDVFSFYVADLCLL